MEADVESRLLQFVERQLDQGNPLADNNAASGLASQKMSPAPPTHILYFLSLWKMANQKNNKKNNNNKNNKKMAT